MQITPAYNGRAHLDLGIYYKTGTDRNSAYGSNSLIIEAPRATLFSLAYNSNTTSTEGAATVTIVKLDREIIEPSV